MLKPDAMTELEIKTRFYVLARRPAPDGTDARRMRIGMVDDVLDAWLDRRATDTPLPLA